MIRSKDGDILADDPDHRVRFQAHDRAVALYGLAGRHTDQAGGEPPPEVPIHVNIVFFKPPNRNPQPDIPEVKFLPPGPR